MKKEKIAVKEFVNGYLKNATDNLKAKYLKDNLSIVQYIGISDKIKIAERIIQSTMYNKNNKDKHRVCVSSTSRYILFKCIVVNEYTNIGINFSDIANEYDLLAQNNMFDVIFTIVSEKEIEELSNIIDMMSDDVMTNEYEPSRYIETQIDKILDVGASVVAPLIEVINKKIEGLSKKDVEKFTEAFAKQVKKVVKD